MHVLFLSPDAFREVGRRTRESPLPTAGTRTEPLERGWLVNTWFRLHHPDHDRLREMMSFLGRTVKAHARRDEVAATREAARAGP
jgi:hypothetical protein